MSAEQVNVSGSGEPAGIPAPASRGKRFAAVLIDLFFIPAVIGFLITLLLVGLKVPRQILNIIMVVVNMIWLIFRDAFFSPARAMVGLKIISLTGQKVTTVQALIRNLMLIFPLVLVPGYLCEGIRVFAHGSLLIRRIVYGISLLMVLFIGSTAWLATKQVLVIAGMIAALAVPVIFFMKDKEDSTAGARLMDVIAKVRVTNT